MVHLITVPRRPIQSREQVKERRSAKACNARTEGESGRLSDTDEHSRGKNNQVGTSINTVISSEASERIYQNSREV